VKGLTIWMGDESAHVTLAALEEKFMGQVKAFDDGGEDPVRDTSFDCLTDRKGLYLLERVGDKAILKVHGSLTNAYVWWHEYMAGQVTSYEAIKDALMICADDTAIKSIYMDFATGGGVVRGLDTASEMIKRVGAIKPVFAHTDSHAFSAGYWLACTAKQVTASRMAEIGSIGTLIVLENYTGAAEMSGVKYHVFRAGEFKALGLPYEDLTEKAAAYIQDNLEKTNKFFLEHVSRNRNLMMSDRPQWGEGQTFFAEAGMAVGLIDRVTTLAELIGSGASQPLTSDQRRYEMKISPEKLAQIAAGADPQSVLSAEELIQYQASLAGEPEAVAEVPAVAVVVAEEQEPVAQAVAGDVAALLKETGKLEAKLEDANAKLAEAETAKVAMQGQMDALQAVAQAAVANLQNALQLPKEAKSSPVEIVAQYTELQTMMATRFNRQQVTQVPVADETVVGSHPTSFRQN
jgi:signal peptide peptidase SppA